MTTKLPGITTGALIPKGADKMLLMIAEQDRRDKLKAKLLRQIQRSRRIECGMESGFGSDYFDGEDD
jgi:molybdopterin biosynthesis enzyme